jgi:hypothetical protein
VTQPPHQAPLFNDNPAFTDLLGFGGVADAVVRVLVSDGLDPVTVGVQSGWGGGKSTLLNLVEKRLATEHPQVLVVRVDPWEFEDSQDVRGTLISLVLNALQERAVTSELAVAPDRKEVIKAHISRLRSRIAWGRASKVLVSGAISLIPGGAAVNMLGDLVKALMPPEPESGEDDPSDAPVTMAGFRDDFAALLQQDLGISKVAVLVDDLDRCLPPATVASLEAIKLFLSVPNMAFVLAADEDLVAASIDRHLGGVASSEFARRYTEKIVQLPISLPRLSAQDTEAFVALLFAARHLSEADLEVLIGSARERRREGNSPFVVPESGLALETDLALAATVASGLAADSFLTPRAVKRFLNNLAVREQLTTESGSSLPLGVLVRLYLLELRHLTEFKDLAEAQPEGRQELLELWEAWGRPSSEAVPPEHVSPAFLTWAGAEPTLTDKGDEIARYLTIAATLRTDVRVSGPLDAAYRELVQQMLGESNAQRRDAVMAITDLPPADQQTVVVAISDQLLRVNPEVLTAGLDGLCRLAAAQDSLIVLITEQLERPAMLRRFSATDVPLLKPLPKVMQALQTTEGVDERVRETAKEFSD